jgi:leukotriene-A4 hydrolase
VNEWVFQPGLPVSARVPVSDAFQSVDLALADWLKNKKIETSEWSTQEWLHFLRGLPRDLGVARMRRLDTSWRLTESNNDEILDQWLLMAIRNHYEPAYPRLEEFLMTVGRRKYVKPLYDAMDAKRAAAIYEKARPLYHPITQATLDALMEAKQ